MLPNNNENILVKDKKFYVKLILFIVAMYVIDRFNKYYMIEIFNMPSRRMVEVLPFFDFVMVWNSGISFGMFHGHEYSNIGFKFFTVFIVGIIAYFMVKSKSKLEVYAFAMIIAGALGNFTDRFLYGAVADFFYFNYKEFYWPAFNISDSQVFIGAAMLIYQSATQKSGE